MLLALSFIVVFVVLLELALVCLPSKIKTVDSRDHQIILVTGHVSRMGIFSGGGLFALSNEGVLETISSLVI